MDFQRLKSGRDSNVTQAKAGDRTEVRLKRLTRSQPRDPKGFCTMNSYYIIRDGVGSDMKGEARRLIVRVQ